MHWIRKRESVREAAKMTDGEPETNFAYHVLTTLEKRPEKTILVSNIYKHSYKCI